MRIDTKFDLGDEVQSVLYGGKIRGIVAGFVVDGKGILTVRVYHVTDNGVPLATNFYEDEIKAAGHKQPDAG